MGSKKSFKVMLIFLSLILISLFSPVIVGDGGIFVPTIDYWIGAPEEKQIGIIDYDEGNENLIIVVDVKNSSLQSEKAVWIFPIPSDPKDVSIDIIKDIPFLRGKNINYIASDNLDNAYFLMLLSQIYTFPVLFYYAGGMLGASNDMVEIYDHIEKMGLTTEIIGTNNSELFQEYLSQKDVNFTDNISSILDFYINKDYSFVVSWISDIEEFRQEALITDNYYYHYYGYGEPFFMLGVSVDFLTDNIYYPMKLTSIYGEKRIPILLQVKGFVTPLTEYADMQVSYDLDDGISYTEITINSESKNLEQDLWIEEKAPPETILPSIIASNGVIFIILLMAIASISASLLAGIITYFRQKPIFYKFILLGLSNLLSIWGLILICRYVKPSHTFVKKPDNAEKSNSNKFDKTALLTLILSWASIVSLIFCFSFFNPWWFLAMSFFFGFFGIFLSIVTFLGFLFTNDKKRTSFIILFSAFFIMISTFIFISLSHLL